MQIKLKNKELANKLLELVKAPKYTTKCIIEIEVNKVTANCSYILPEIIEEEENESKD